MFQVANQGLRLCKYLLASDLSRLDFHVHIRETLWLTIDSRRYRTPPSQWTLGYVAPPDKGFTLKVTVPRDRPVEFDLMARSLGVPQVAGVAIPQRPSGVVPFQTGDITVVYRRVRFEDVGKPHSGM